MSRSKMDVNHIQQITFDEDAEAVRVLMLPTDMSIELSAEDGDSVQTQKQMQVLEVLANQIIDTSKASKICILSEDLSVESVSAIALVLNKEIHLMELVPGHIEAICVPAIKLSVNCIVILQS